MELERFLFKNIMIKDKNGIIHKGFVDLYSSAEDNDDTEQCIGIIPTRESTSGKLIYESEIAEIEVID